MRREDETEKENLRGGGSSSAPLVRYGRGMVTREIRVRAWVGLMKHPARDMSYNKGGNHDETDIVRR